MLKFPVISSHTEPPLPKMSLLEYAEFSESCLRHNPAITPENCMTKRTDEATMQPFRLPPPQKKP
jgi:hypothetical protein